MTATKRSSLALQVGSRHAGALRGSDAMEKNIATMQSALKKYGLSSRPHTKTHKCAAIAKISWPPGRSASPRQAQRG